MVDKDGSAKYSNIVGIIIKQTKSFDASVYPNPVKAGETIKLKLNATLEGKVNITLVNNNGKIVSNKSIQVNAGYNLIELNARYISSGNYSVLVSVGNDIMQVPIIVE